MITLHDAARGLSSIARRFARTPEGQVLAGMTDNLDGIEELPEPDAESRYLCARGSMAWAVDLLHSQERRWRRIRLVLLLLWVVALVAAIAWQLGPAMDHLAEHP